MFYCRRLKFRHRNKNRWFLPLTSSSSPFALVIYVASLSPRNTRFRGDPVCLRKFADANENFIIKRRARGSFPRFARFFYALGFGDAALTASTSLRPKQALKFSKKGSDLLFCKKAAKKLLILALSRSEIKTKGRISVRPLFLLFFVEVYFRALKAFRFLFTKRKSAVKVFGRLFQKARKIIQTKI